MSGLIYYFLVPPFILISMQIKSVLLLLVIGAVAVFAKKGSSEEDDGDFNAFSFGSYAHQFQSPRPSSLPKGRFQVSIVGTPGFSFYQPQQQHSLPTAFPQLIALRVQKFFEGIQRQMQELSENAYSGFQLVETEIENNRKALEKSLIDRLESTKNTILAKQAKQVEMAVKDGKDQEKIESCIRDQLDNFKIEMDEDVKRTTDCIIDANVRARQALTAARNAFTEKSVASAWQARNLAQEIAFCFQRRDARCAEGKMAAINQVALSTAQEGFKQIQRVKEAPEKQMIQMNYCSQNLIQDLRELRGEYNAMLNKCTDVATEEIKPAEEGGGEVLDEDEDVNEHDGEDEEDLE